MSALAAVKQCGWVAPLTDPEGQRMDRLQAVQSETALLHFGKPAERHLLQKLEKYNTLKPKPSEPTARTGLQCLAF